MSGNQNANFEVIALASTQNFYTGKETGIMSANTPHQIFCLASGNITITPMQGPNFTFTATAGQSIDVLFKATTVNAGTFIAFRSKFQPGQGRGAAWQY